LKNESVRKLVLCKGVFIRKYFMAVWICNIEVYSHLSMLQTTSIWLDTCWLMSPYWCTNIINPCNFSPLQSAFHRPKNNKVLYRTPDFPPFLSRASYKTLLIGIIESCRKTIGKPLSWLDFPCFILDLFEYSRSSPEKHHKNSPEHVLIT